MFFVCSSHGEVHSRTESFCSGKVFQNPLFCGSSEIISPPIPGGNPPDKTNIWRNVNKYEVHGTISLKFMGSVWTVSVLR